MTTRYSQDIDARILAIERLTQLFRMERIVHLGVTMFALALLFTVAGLMIYKQTAGSIELTLLFGSSGLITYTAGRVLRMWSDALRIVSGERFGEER